MGAFPTPLTLEECLAWEAGQEDRWEFDGIQPVAMTDASIDHARMVTRVILAPGPRLRRGCEVLAHDLQVVANGRVRYPDLAVVCGPVAANAADVAPVVILEVLSPSTSLVDLRVKALEYADHPTVQAHVTLDPATARAVIRRRAAGWREEVAEGVDAVIDLPEIGATLPMGAVYPS